MVTDNHSAHLYDAVRHLTTSTCCLSHATEGLLARMRICRFELLTTLGMLWYGPLTCAFVQVSNFSNPSTLEGVSMASLLLGMLGNGLMVPRALFTGDKIWFIGVGWGPLTGWVQLLSLYVAYGVTGYVLAMSVPDGQLSWQCVCQRLPDACM